MRWYKRGLAGCAWNTVLAAAWLCSAVLIISPAARAQDSCRPLYDASDKLLTGPSHAYQTESNPARPGSDVTNHEIIYTGGAIYVMMKGKWTKSPMSAAAMHAQEEENKKTAKNVSCKHLRDESVKGESAAVYSGHSETDDTKADTQTWISKSKGLLLRQEEDVDIGGGDKRHFSIRFEYTNVQAPAVSP
jgi:hypothetical protein